MEWGERGRLWAVDLLRFPDREVRSHTGVAARAVRGEEDVVVAARVGRAALAPLPGFGVGDALASAALVTVDPAWLPVYDRHSPRGPAPARGLSLTHRAWAARPVREARRAVSN